jgi:hypothetical protein
MIYASRFVIGLLSAALLAVSAASPAFADYGFSNWQTTFAGTGVIAGTGQSFGFWGWCAFSGGVTSGNGGECEFAQYFHSPSGGFTCHEEVDIDSWTIAPGTIGGAPGGPPANTFHITGTAQVTPSGATVPCLSVFPGGASFTNVDSGIPAAPGHYNVGGLGPGLKGEFQLQVTQVG